MKEREYYIVCKECGFEFQDTFKKNDDYPVGHYCNCNDDCSIDNNGNEDHCCYVENNDIMKLELAQ
jgi:hypothetical protein